MKSISTTAFILLVSSLTSIILFSCEKPEPTPNNQCSVTDNIYLINDKEDDYLMRITADNYGVKSLEIEERNGGKSFAPFVLECGEWNHEGFKVIVSCCSDVITVY
jgi:hypothetical protein